MSTEFIKQLREHWVVAAAIGAGLVAWGTNTATLAFAQERATEDRAKVLAVENKVEAVEEDIDDINQSLVRIDTNQMHITSDIEDIKIMLRDVANAIEREREAREAQD